MANKLTPELKDEFEQLWRDYLSTISPLDKMSLGLRDKIKPFALAVYLEVINDVDTKIEKAYSNGYEDGMSGKHPVDTNDKKKLEEKVLEKEKNDLEKNIKLKVINKIEEDLYVICKNTMDEFTTKVTKLFEE